MQAPPKRTARRISRKATALLVCAALALAVALVCLLPVIRARFPAQTGPGVSDPGFRTLGTLDSAAVDSITITHADGSSYVLRMCDGALHLEYEGELRPVNESLAADVLRAATALGVERVVSEDADEVNAHLSDMGLEPPRASALVHLTDGTQSTVSVGHRVPETGYYYYRWSGSEGVYMCDEGVADALTMQPNLLLPVEQPSIAASLIREVVITRGPETLQMTFAADADGYVCGDLLQPFVYPMSSSAAASVINALGSFHLGAFEAHLTDANRASYGFDAPLCTVSLTQGGGVISAIDVNGALNAVELPPQTLNFAIGREEGEYFYTCEYKGDCYLVSRFLVKTLVELDANRLATRTPADMSGALLAAIVIEAPAGTADMRIARSERVFVDGVPQTDENGSIVYDLAVTLNGAPVPAQQYTTLCNRLAAMTVSDDLPQGWTPPAGAQPRWRIVLTTEGGDERQIDAYRLDAFTDALVVNGRAQHCVYVEAIDAVMADLLQP